MFEQVVGTAVAYLDLNTTGFNTKLKSAWDDLNAVGDKSLTLGQKMQGVGNGMQTIGNEMTKNFTVPIVGAFGVAVAKTTEFDKAMSNVQALAKSGMQDVTAETEALRQKAIELGGSTKFTSKEVSDAFGYMALAGWDTQQMLEGINGVLNLAAASDMDLAQASDIVTDYISAFGKEAKDAAEMVDMMAYAQANSNMTTVQLGDAFHNSAAVMHGAGQEMNTTVAILEAMANQGNKGAQAGTALSAVARDMTQKMFEVKDATQAAKLAEEGLASITGDLNDLIGVQSIQIGDWVIPVSDAKGNFRDFIDILSDVEKATDGMGSAEQSAALMTTFTARSIKAVNNVLTEGTDNVRKYREELDASGGTAEDISKTMLDNLAGSITLLTSALDNLFIKIGDRLVPYIRRFADMLTELTTKLSSMSDEEFDRVVKIAAAIAAFGPALSILGKVVTLTGGLFNLVKAISDAGGVVKIVDGAFKTFGTNIIHIGEAFKLAKAGYAGFAAETSTLGAALGSITAPIAAVIAAIGVLIAAFVHLWKTNEEFRNNITAIWDGLKERFAEAGQKIVDALNELGFEFEDIVDVLKAAWEGLCELLAPMFIGSFNMITTAIGSIVNVFADVIEIISGLIKGLKTGDWSLFWEGLGDIATDAIEGLLKIFDSLIEALWNIVKTAANLFGADWDMTWDDAKQAVVTWCEDVQQWFKDLHENIRDFFVGIAEWIVNLPENITEGIVGVIESIAEWGKNLVEKGKEVGSNFVTSVVEWFEKLPERIGYAIGYVLGTIAKWVIDMTQKAIELGTKFVENIVEWFQKLPERISEFIENAKQTIADFVTNSIEKAIELGTQFIENIVEWFQQLPEKIHEFIETTIQNIIQFKDDVIAAAKEAGENFVKNVIEFFTTLPDRVKEFLDKTIENLKQWILDMGQKGKEAVEELIKNIVETAKEIPEKVKEIGKNIVDGIWKGIKESKNEFKSNVKGFLSGIVSGAKDALEIKSPSRVFANEVGKWIPLGIAEGVKEEMPIAANDIQSSIEDEMNEVSPEVKLKTSVETFGDTFISTFNNVLSWIESIEDRFIESINNMTNALLDLSNKAMSLNDMNNITQNYQSMNMLSAENSEDMLSKVYEMIQEFKSFISDLIYSVLDNISENTNVGDITIPVYIGNELIDNIIVTSNQRVNYLTGGL